MMAAAAVVAVAAEVERTSKVATGSPNSIAIDVKVSSSS